MSVCELRVFVSLTRHRTTASGTAARRSSARLQPDVLLLLRLCLCTAAGLPQAALSCRAALHGAAAALMYCPQVRLRAELRSAAERNESATAATSHELQQVQGLMVVQWRCTSGGDGGTWLGAGACCGLALVLVVGVVVVVLAVATSMVDVWSCCCWWTDEGGIICSEFFYGLACTFVKNSTTTCVRVGVQWNVQGYPSACLFNVCNCVLRL